MISCSKIKMPTDSVSGNGLFLTDGGGYAFHLAEWRTDALIPFMNVPP